MIDLGTELIVPIIDVFLQICGFEFVAFGQTFTLKSVFVFCIVVGLMTQFLKFFSE